MIFQSLSAFNQLMVQIQEKDQAITNMRSETDQLVSALRAAEGRINDLYADQGRTEVEIAQRIDISEKLRGQLREADKEKRDIHRRYNEQVSFVYV
jgi:DNA-binding CsgD family transcriptional regulator